MTYTTDDNGVPVHVPSPRARLRGEDFKRYTSRIEVVEHYRIEDFSGKRIPTGYTHINRYARFDTWRECVDDALRRHHNSGSPLPLHIVTVREEDVQPVRLPYSVGTLYHIDARRGVWHETPVTPDLPPVTERG